MREISFLPGPVSVHPECRKAFIAPPFSHRSERFEKLARAAEGLLCRLTRARHCTFLMGSATLANDVVAAQLSLLGGKGLIIVNGEFGERLAEQAARFRLGFERADFEWASPADYQEISRKLNGKKWLWFAHCETSTGTLNDPGKLRALCARKGIKVCVDAASSLGCVPVDFSGIYLAAGTSGKGLGALPGISFVLSNHCPPPALSIPKYLDIGYYRRKNLVPFTFSSNLLAALKAGAVKSLKCGGRRKTKAISALIEKCMRTHGIRHANESAGRADFMLTLAPGPGVPAEELGRFLQKRGILVHYRNAYLSRRNWFQVALMGNVKITEARKLAGAVNEFYNERRAGRGKNQGKRGGLRGG